MSRYTPPLEIANTIYEYITCVEVKNNQSIKSNGYEEHSGRLRIIISQCHGLTRWYLPVTRRRSRVGMRSAATVPPSVGIKIVDRSDEIDKFVT